MPFFNLDKIRAAAAQHHIRYKGLKVSKDIRNLGYTLEEVSTCIISLTPADFQKTIEYPDQSAHDVYIKNVTQEERTDRIYMKLRLLENGEIQIVEIGSFHL
ncbi:MAG: type II toxin-antitoxin system MqsR family toxin [Methylococcaceae bacterium]